MRQPDPARLPALQWEIEVPGYDRIVVSEMPWQYEEELYQTLFLRRALRQHVRMAAVEASHRSRSGSAKTARRRS